LEGVFIKKQILNFFQEVAQFICAASNQMTITLDPNCRMENDIGESGDDLLNSSAASGSGCILQHLVWIACILMAILCGMLLYGIFFPANSTNQAPMSEQTDATNLYKQFDLFRDKLGLFTGVVDDLKALIKSQSETIAELSAKTEELAKGVN
jgi:hypothetical protein